MLKNKLVILLTVLLVIMPLSGIVNVKSQPAEYRGPLIDTKEVYIVPDYSVQLLKFEAGELDMVTVLPKDVERVTKNRPDAQIIYIRPVHLTLGHLSFNVRETVNGKWNPWSIKELRQAMAHLINRDEIIALSPLKGMAEKSTTIVSHRYGDWVNPDKSKVDFEVKYPFSFEKANQLLDKAGFLRGPDGWRRDPKTGEILTLEIAVLPEAVGPVYYYIALKYKENAEKVGIKVVLKTMSISEMVAGVMSRTLQSWLLGYYYGAYPTYYYYNYHSKEDRWVNGKPEGINYFGVRNATLDKYLDEFLFTLDIDKAKKAFWKAQEILTDLVPTIPCYLPITIIAIDGKWENIPFYYAPPYDKPVDIYDPENPNTFLFDMMIREKGKNVGGVFRDVVSGFSALNPLTSILLTENILENYIYDPLTISNPANIYDLKSRIKLLIEDWKVEPVVFEDGKEGTKLTAIFRKDIKWHDGVPMTAYDMEWTILEAGVKRRLFWAYPEMVRQLKEVKVVDPYTIEIYVYGRSWQYELDLLTFRPVPRHIWSKVPDLTIDPSREPHPSRKDLTLMVGNGRWILKEYVPGTKLVFVWNPNYHLKSLEKVPQITVDAPTSLEENQKATVTINVKDYLGNPASEAKVTITLKGPIERIISASQSEPGIFKEEIGPLVPGDYQVNITAEIPVPYGAITNTKVFSITVKGLGITPLPGVEIKKPGIPSELLPPYPTPVMTFTIPEFKSSISGGANLIVVIIVAIIFLAEIVIISMQRGM